MSAPELSGLWKAGHSGNLISLRKKFYTVFSQLNGQSDIPQDISNTYNKGTKEIFNSPSILTSGNIPTTLNDISKCQGRLMWKGRLQWIWALKRLLLTCIRADESKKWEIIQSMYLTYLPAHEDTSIRRKGNARCPALSGGPCSSGNL